MTSGRAVVAPEGELDIANAGVLESRVEDVLAEGARTLIVDLSRLAFVDSTALRYLLRLAECSRRDGFALELVPGPSHVMRLFELTRTREVLPFSRPG